jgi:hypothetical protein
LPIRDVSFVGHDQNHQGMDKPRDLANSASEDACRDARFGCIGGVLALLGLLAITGIGPIVATG